ncbi:MAG: hypothetical protein ACOC1K_04225 [Nanoarchaeota archaeon]
MNSILFREWVALAKEKKFYERLKIEFQENKYSPMYINSLVQINRINEKIKKIKSKSHKYNFGSDK